MSTENQTEKKAGLLDPKSNFKALIRIITIVFVLVAGVWLFIRFTAGEKAANKVTNAILQRPMDLQNSIENLPASSMKGVALSLPYSGTLTVETTVMKGNEVDVYVVTPDQIENIKNKKEFTHLQGFEAQKTKNYRRSGRLAKGDYFLVMIDTTMGILSSSSSDIKIHTRLEP